MSKHSITAVALMVSITVLTIWGAQNAPGETITFLLGCVLFCGFGYFAAPVMEQWQAERMEQRRRRD